MIYGDKWLVEFIGHNGITLYVLYTILKGIAMVTPWDGDNRILESFWNAVKAFKGGKTNETT